VRSGSENSSHPSFANPRKRCSGTGSPVCEADVGCTGPVCPSLGEFLGWEDDGLGLSMVEVYSSNEQCSIDMGRHVSRTRFHRETGEEIQEHQQKDPRIGM
jgi:hypothetical protein